MNKLNLGKKSEFLTLSLILILLIIAGFYFISDKIGEKYTNIEYVGDSVNHIFYNLNSHNPSCDFNAIGIYKENIVYFKNVPHCQIYCI